MSSWDWQVFCRDTISGEDVAGCFAQGGDQTYLQWMLHAWGWTVTVSLSALAVALFMGSVVGVLRTLPNSRFWLRLGNGWVELFRNIPLLVQVFIWYYVVPGLIPATRDVSPMLLMIVALGLFTSARVAEQLRSGIQALPRGQRYAGMALGFTTWQYYRFVLLPMAYRIILPPLTSESMNIFKNSAVAFAVSIPELTQFYLQAGEETGRQIEIYLGVLVLYVISALAVNRVMTVIERRLRVPGMVAAGGAGGH
ncbi:MAG TPA: amino acid ABC transporter permease [Roseateles sp.]|nr:amino acid ABC transporter permease [Roseateles sp.]